MRACCGTVLPPHWANTVGAQLAKVQARQPNEILIYYLQPKVRKAAERPSKNSSSNMAEMALPSREETFAFADCRELLEKLDREINRHQEVAGRDELEPGALVNLVDG